jgi:hypothetical protein
MTNYFTLVSEIINKSILFTFQYIYKTCKIETIEDRYHKDKMNDNDKINTMNKVILKFNNSDEFIIVKNNIMNLMENKTLTNKFNVSSESILNKTNNKMHIIFKMNCICIYFNHYYISGSTMFIFLNSIVNGSPPTFFKTNPLLGIAFLPFYIYDLCCLKKLEYTKRENQTVDFITESNLNTGNKRFYLYSTIMRNIYTSLQLNRPMTVALTVAFDELPYLNNNVGIIMIQYNITDTVEIIERKIKNAGYQAYVSNFILNCPLPNLSSFELRDYVDCIISSMYIKSDFDFKIGWNCCKPTVEQMYVGSVSLLHSNGTMDINMVMNTCSSNYNKINTLEYVEHFFEE